MEIPQDVNKWKAVEDYLRKKTYLPFCKTRQVWWCSIGLNIGHEIYGKNSLFERPVLILQIYDREMVLIVPLTSKEHQDNKYAFPVMINGIAAYALFSQVRTVSIKRFSQKIERLSSEIFREITRKYIESINSQSRLAPALDLAENPLETPPEGR